MAAPAGRDPASPAAGVFALLADGTTAEIRAAAPEDVGAVRVASQAAADPSCAACARRPGSRHGNDERLRYP
jgi:hypothetical protein